MSGAHILVAALFAYIAVLVLVNRAMRRWDQQSQQERKRLEDSNADWRGLAAHRRVIIQELEARCDVLVSELDKAQRLGRRDEERYNCGDREVASDEVAKKCEWCHNCPAECPELWVGFPEFEKGCICSCHGVEGGNVSSAGATP